MSNILKHAVGEIRSIISSSSKLCCDSSILPCDILDKFGVKVKYSDDNCDFVCDAAVINADDFHMSPVNLAGTLIKNFTFDGEYIESCTADNDGTMRFKAHPQWFYNVLSDVTACTDVYGRSLYGRFKRVSVIMASIDPTHPIGQNEIRSCIVGDCAAHTMTLSGYRVTREILIDNSCENASRFADLLEKSYLGIFSNENNDISDENVKAIVNQFALKYADSFIHVPSSRRKESLLEFAMNINIEKIKSELKKYGIQCDTFSNISSVSDTDIKNLLHVLSEKGVTFEKDGDTYAKLSSRDVKLTENGKYSSFIMHAAYLYSKYLSNSCDIISDIYSSDNIDYDILNEILKCLDIGADCFKGVCIKPVISDSADISCDSVRFLFNSKNPSEPLKLCAAATADTSKENPLFRVKQVYSKVNESIEKLNSKGIVLTDEIGGDILSGCLTAHKKDIIRCISQYTDVITNTAITCNTALITEYLMSLTELVSEFLSKNDIPADSEKSACAELYLLNCIKITVKNALTALAID